MATLVVNTSQVFGVNDPAAVGVTELDVNGASTVATFDATLAPGNFGTSNLSANLLVSGSGQIVIDHPTSFFVDLSGWTFSSWTGRLEVDGGGDGDTIIGTSQNDILYGNDGNDVLSGGAGDDKIAGGTGIDTIHGDDGNDLIVFTDQDADLYGDQAYGDAGIDTLWTSGSLNFTNVTLGGFEKLLIDNFDTSGADNSLTFLAEQIAGAFSSDLQVTGSFGADTLNITGQAGVAVDLSHWTFANWSASDALIFYGSSGADTVTGSSQKDTLLGSGGDDVLHGGGGDDVLAGDTGADQVYGDDGNDFIYVNQTDWVAGDLVDGGAGVDTLVTFGSIDFTGHTVAGFEAITMDWLTTQPDSLSLTFTASQVANGLATNLELKGSTRSDTPDSFVITGEAGVKVDLGHWSFREWNANDALVFHGSAGAETVVVNALSGNYQVTLGGGADTLELAATASAYASADMITVTDFQAGAGGDRLELTNYLNSWLQNYTAGSDPFALRHLQLVQSGSDTLVQVDRDGGGDSFTTLITLKNTDAHALTAENLDGFTSNLLSPPHVVTGGAGVDTVSYAGLYRAYTVSASGGAATVAGGPEGAGDNLIGVERIKFADGYFATGTSDAAGQVYRIYEAALGREPDATGLANWVHSLGNGASLQTIVNGFIDSDEFIGRFGHGDDTSFVTLLYNNVLHRDPDAGGLQNWLDYLHTGHSRADTVIGFSESQEFINTTASAVQHGLWVGDEHAAQVARLYDTMFSRLPDSGGEINWTQSMAGGTSLTQIAQGFVASQEFQATYGALNDDAFINLLYNNVLHRDADPSGLQNWQNFLNDGHSRAEVVVGFSESPEHIGNTAIHTNDGIWFA